MTMLWRTSWRNLTRKKLRTLFSFIAIVLGVSTMLAVIAAVETTKNFTEERLKLYLGNAHFSLLSNQDFFDAKLADQLKKEPSVTDSLSVIHKHSRFELTNQDVINDENNRIRLTGLDSFNNTLIQLKPLAGSLDQEGIIIPRTTANLWNIKIGDTVKLTFENVTKETKIAAIVEDTPLLEGPSDLEKAQTKAWRAAVSLTSLQQWTGLENQIQEVRFRVDEKADHTAIREQLNQTVKQVDPNTYLLPVVLDDRQANKLDDLYTLFYLIGALAMFISVFILFNSLYVTITERKREIAVMKTIGYTPFQVCRMFLFEVFLLSSLGTAVGIFLGYQMAKQLQKLIFSSFQANFDYQMNMTFAIPISVAIGIFIPLLASLIPIIKASRVNIVESLKPSMTEAMKPNKWRIILGCIILLGVLIDTQIFPLVCLFTGMTLLFPTFLRLIRQLIAPLFRWILGYEGVVASENITRHLNRSANMATILSLGICFAVFLTNISYSLEKNVDKEVTSSFGGNIQMKMEYSISPDMLRSIKEIEEVEDLTTYQEIAALWKKGREDRQFSVISVNHDWMKKHPLFSSQQETIEELLQKLDEPDTILLGHYAYSEWGGKLNQTMELDTPFGKKAFKVVGTVDTSKHGGYVAFMSDRYYQAHFGQKEATDLLITTKPGKEEVVKQKLIENFGDQYISINTVSQEIEQQKRAIPTITLLFNALLILALCTAGIGIANTLLMNVMERIREIGVMRSVAFTNFQIRKMIMCESLIIGITGILVGIVTGLIMTYLISLSSNTSTTLEFFVSWPTIIMYSLFGILISLLASWLPASRAVKTPLHVALRYE